MQTLNGYELYLSKLLVLIDASFRQRRVGILISMTLNRKKSEEEIFWEKIKKTYLRKKIQEKNIGEKIIQEKIGLVE